MSLFTKKSSAQAYFKAPEMQQAFSGCGTSCGSGDKEPTEQPSSCGTGEKEPDEKPSACGSACGAGDK